MRSVPIQDKPESIESMLRRQTIESPEFAEAVSRIATDQFLKMSLEQRLSRRQMAKLYSVHPDTIDNLNPEELRKLGWEKIYVGSLPRFQRISMVDTNRETFRRVKRESR